MSNLATSLYNLRYIDQLARGKSLIHNINPVSKFLTTMLFSIVVISFDKSEVLAFLPFFLYPLVLIALSDIPFFYILKRLIFIEPFIVFIAVLNPIFVKEKFVLLGFTISAGWIFFVSIVIKVTLTVISALVLIATTGIEKIAYALTVLKVPKLFVLQIVLTYRYIFLLLEETITVINAYSMRASGRTAIIKKAWGSLLSVLLIRTIKRSEMIYNAMLLRAFKGEFRMGDFKLRLIDILFFAFWAFYFILCRFVNIPLAFGKIFLSVKL